MRTEQPRPRPSEDTRERPCTTPSAAASRPTTTPALHPEVLAALADANGGHQIAYGEDAYTARLQEVVAGHFGAGAEAFPVFNGTGANVVALQALLPRWGAVVCAETAHINTDEGGAPERMGGIKLLTVPTPGRQAHARADRPAGVGLGRRAPRAAARRLDHPDHRARHLLHARRDRARSATTRTRSACGCTSTAPASPTPPRPSAPPVRLHRRRRRRRR